MTGDRVVVTRAEDGSTKVAVTPAPRADGSTPTFRRMAWEGHYYVIPDDVASLIPEHLDRRLFDVTGLVAAGYDDAGTDGVPVLVQTSEPGSGLDPARGVDWTDLGVTRGRSLRSIGSVAGEVSKAEGRGRLVEAVKEASEQPAVASRGPRTAITKVWLDGPVRALDAVSTPQVGAPQAWASGATGAGVTVAVLDTGVDAEHPDLADAVVAAEDFSGTGSPDDVYGHGTHVAGIVTGNGAASDGAIVGVAPDAVIMNGKVLDDFGSGSDSQIIAGMEWAATGGADVVNMSLGLPGGYTDGTDPLAMAVDELSAAHDVLFVIAAGNEGAYGTVTTPGSAALALTVSAVDSADQPTGFTSRGPRSDGGAKPDIAAPGEEILAPMVGYPTESTEPYLSASGTSMAAPHVAGVAALVAQARPALDGQQLKSVLVASAVDVGASVFDVGAGRVFAPSALDQQVFTSPSALGFGIFPYPQTDAEAVTQTLTYVNVSDDDLVLSLSTEVTLQDGSPAPEGTLTLGADAVTVPAGGSAEVAVTVDPAAAGVAAGRVGGAVVATDGGEETVRTAVMSVNEPEMYDLTIVATARDGSPGVAASAGVTPLGQHEGLTFEQVFPFFDEDGTATVRLPVGPYGVMGVVPEVDLETFEMTSMDAVNVPEIELGEDMTVHLDATEAVPVTVTTQRRSEQVMTDQQLFREGEMAGVVLGYGAFGPVSLGAVPSEPVTLGTFSWMHRHLRLPPGASLDTGDYRYLYDLAYVEHERLPEVLRYAATKKTTTQVSADYNAMSDAGSTGWSARFALDSSGWAFATAWPVQLPVEREEYVSASPDIQWFGMLDVLGGMAVIETPRAWTTEPGGRITERWLHQVHHHSSVDGFVGTLFGEIFAHAVAAASDDHGHAMFAVFDPSVVSSRSRLWFDGQLVADEASSAAITQQLPEPGTPVRALVETTVDHPEWQRSTAYSTEWRYLAPPVAGEDGIALADLVNVRYGATGMDDHNRSARTVRLDLWVVDGLGEPATGVRGLRLWVSGDQGRTWREVAVKGSVGSRHVNVVVPRGASTISLRAEAWTADARVTDTVIDAIDVR